MKNTTAFIICFQLIIPLAFSQSGEAQQKAFDSIFRHTYIHISGQDMNRALYVADSLNKNAVDDLQKLRSLMLKAELYQRQNSREKAIGQALEAEKLARANKSYEWQARISGFLATQYRIAGLKEKGRTFLEKGLAASNQIHPENLVPQYKGMVYHEMAYYAMADKEYDKAIQLLEKAATFFEEVGTNEQSMIYKFADIEQLVAENYFRLGEYVTARNYYEAALARVESIGAGNSVMGGRIYCGLGGIYLEEKLYPKAFEYLTKTLTIAESSDHATLKGLAYKGMSLYYRRIEDLDNYALYNDKYLESIRGLKASEQDVVQAAFRDSQEQWRKLNSRYYMVIALGVFLLLVMSSLLITHRQKRRKEYQRFLKIIGEMRKNQHDVPDRAVRQEDRNSREKELMPKATEELLLQKLSRFETSEKFRDKKISLSVLAAKMDTNTKYLSHLINKYKEKDFSRYINELRIGYIIRKMEEDPAYLHYKISYLAEECGFSSHSKFTTVFKSVAGMPPSAFMGYLEKRKKVEKEEEVAV